MLRKVHIVNGAGDDLLLFEGNFLVVDNYLDADFICFTGGADISPKYYHQKPHPITHSNAKRDEYEFGIATEAMIEGIPMVGICRGAQLLHVVSGGTLIQHVCHHLTAHTIVTDTSESMIAAANHHQMMDIRSTPSARLLAVASGLTPGPYEGSNRKQLTAPCSDPEVVFHESTKCLCHQPHPEWMTETARYREWFYETLDLL
jgi:anthranilate/para-aminobenzoate synthase component II